MFNLNSKFFKTFLISGALLSAPLGFVPQTLDIKTYSDFCYLKNFEKNSNTPYFLKEPLPEELESIEKEIKLKLTAFKIPDFNLEVYSSKELQARADLQTNTIYVSKAFVDNPDISKEELVAIIGHELGHLIQSSSGCLNGKSLQFKEHLFESELKADKFSQSVLVYLDYSPYAMASVLKKIHENKDFLSETHPPLSRRINNLK